MKQKINSRLLFISMVVLALATVSITFVYYGLFQEQVKKDLRVEAELLKNAGITEFVKNEAMLSNEDIRITWIKSDGSVIYDNDANAEYLSNHLNRPEVDAAFKRGVGESVRESDTMNMRTFYYAIIMDDGTVLRVATEARSLLNVFLSASGIIIFIIILIIVLCIFISHFLTVQLLEPIKRLADSIDDNSSIVGYKELEPFMNRIREQHEDILASAKSRQDFTANVSHELKTPLTAISGYAELIENRMVDEEKVIHFSAEIRKNADRLVSLINDIIRLSELDHKESTPEFVSLDLYEIAEERLELLRSNAREKNIQISLKGENCMVLSNKGMLIELIDNLVQNAIRYNVQNGMVEVCVDHNKNHAVLKVSDSGIGIPKDEQKRVFERFYRVDKSRSRETGGTGLGLAIVKHIVEIHDGSIELESEVKKGTSITVYL
ncbi:MAG: two-component sensor histidine kinase [Lachnospiraceae bacterium]|nr:two-component sensor histidine kinase [Lachnospiraceae bacterium]MEE0920056.1 ATP-binding protein [Lachnospiraceae bacterium]